MKLGYRNFSYGTLYIAKSYIEHNTREIQWSNIKQLGIKSLMGSKDIANITQTSQNENHDHNGVENLEFALHLLDPFLLIVYHFNVKLKAFKVKRRQLELSLSWIIATFDYCPS